MDNLTGFWIVPKETLLAYTYTNTGEKTKAVDQTVWVITSSENGYFSGKSYLSLDNIPISSQYLNGSITPLGDVLISFVSENSTQTTGFGKFVKNKFLMQMNQFEGNSGIEHWSYMIRINPCDPEFFKLPGTDKSLIEFVTQF